MSDAASDAASDALTVGIVGHVDHGKTALVRALTGIETDRLKEERERGLSIVLGFAYLETSRGVVDLIDVPGHEDFIRAMIGGATALDGIVLCVAADEGVMPQTVEHFNIARLLGVERGLVVLTKTDLVDADMLEHRKQALDAFVHDTFLAGAEVIEVSAVSGAGIDAVREALERIAAACVEREARGRFFLPLDRVFTIRGFGLVATGTLRSGCLAVGDAVEIMPAGRPATVRALQNHSRSVESIAPGQRVAVNLRHVDRDQVNRGDVLAPPGALQPATRLDTKLRVLENAAPLKNGAVLRCLTGTTHAMAKLRLLDRRELAPGEAAMAQLSLDRAIATQASEHCLLRGHSPMQTIAGGRILAVNAGRHRRYDTAVTRRLATAASGDRRAVVEQRLDEAGRQGIDIAALADELGDSRETLVEVIAELDTVDIGEKLIVAASAYDELLTEIVTALERFHEAHPFKKGLEAGALINELASKPSNEVLRHALKRLVDDGKVQNAREILSIADYDPLARLNASERELVAEIEQTFLASGLQALTPQSAVGSDRAKQAVYRLLLETGQLVRLKTYDRSSQLVVHAKALDDAKQAIEREFPSPAAFALKDIRDLLGSTRKHVVPLMEHLDATGTTVRSGDLRRLR